uniref:C2 domain-containing protein n=1 Tax=Leptobrachium leishanense TaxID=445787 RepID=A0A8C5QKH4_9ANUR
MFRWPHYGKLVFEEVLTVKLYNCSKVFSNRLLGTLIVSLQHLPESGRLTLREALVDKNYSITGVSAEGKRGGGWGCMQPYSLREHVFFQIAVTVTQAQKLVGVNIDPVVHVKVGDEKRHTVTQKSTNCPYYNQVVHAKKIPFFGTRLGIFKIDVGTVYNQPDHRFLQKWAVVTDPKDTRAGIKGFVKCNLSVVTKGDPMNAPPSSTSGQNDDIEKNLLLPKKVPAERPWSKISVKIFKAEGLPNMSSGIMGSFSKIVGERKVFIDPYVQVTFAGQQGETSVESDSIAPEWNEQISFIEQFPPLARKMKIQVLDDAHIGDAPLATHYIDLRQISDPSRNAGFNPTFGPAWINLYGSPHNYTLRDIHRDMNEGLGEGVFYRGRILASVTLDIFNNNTVQEKKPLKALKNAFSKLKMKKKSKIAKEKEKGAAAEDDQEGEGDDESKEQPNEVTVEVDDILPLPENALGVKEEFLLFGVFFEITMIDPSIGNKPIKFEVSIGKCNCRERQGLLDTGSEDELENDTPPPVSDSFNCITLDDNKPCIHVWSYWEDHTWRLYNSNWIVKIAERLERGLEEVDKLTRRPKSNPEVRLKKVLEEFVAGLCVITLQPQCTLPDVLIWLFSNNKRIAYARIPAQNILYSVVEEEKGKDCGKISTTPASYNREIFAKAEIYLWLGVTKYVKNSISDLPEDFKPIYEKDDYYYFQLRAHIYQARGIIAADDNGLSDPYAKVVFGNQCQTTQVIPETLAPLWNELLIYDRLTIDGNKEDLKNDPPLIIINMYDMDKFGSPDFLGRAFATPIVTLLEEDEDEEDENPRYVPPALQFFDITKGNMDAGELIAIFELIELDTKNYLEPTIPDFVEPKEPEFMHDESERYIIPRGIRPVLKEFRIEVLFWGLRDLKRINLFEVNQPQVRIECAGKKVESEVIMSYQEFPNFTELVKSLDVELPEQVYLHPPLSIFVVEKRAFGRSVMVGTSVVSHLMKFAPKDLEDMGEEPEDKPKRKCFRFCLPYLDFQLGAPAELGIYNTELENEFGNFEDWLYVFPLHHGKALDDEDANEEDNFMGRYKGSFYIYPAEQATAEFQIMKGVPRNRPVKVLVRIYIVKATNLAPADPNGKADPYVVVKVGEQEKNSKERYIPKQLNPVFGEVFELTISYPLETELTILVYDHDLIGSDDLIGETKMDLENRFYSNHRANCGVASQFDLEGYNTWRDAFKPTQILSALCKKHALDDAEYRREEVKVNNKIFKIPPEAFPKDYDEHQALYVLQHWDEMPEFGTKLVPEHVEVRTLYNDDSPGMGQGALHMWIDMFPNDVPAPPPVNIKPREPVSYELRVIIWNTDDVILDDVNPFTGTPSSDIYVKGWMRGLDGEKQETDVHFNSLTGEGNFNWRFIFHFDYLPTEKEITYKKKDSIFSLEESEFREPAVLALQVWDYDRISANDFLGSLELRLNDMVRGAKTAQQCTIKMSKDKATPRFSIIRNKRMRGWWPFIKLKSEEDIEREEREEKDKKKKKKKKRKHVKPEDVQFQDSSGNTYILAGKVEAEFQLLTKEEAEKNPVGVARKEPEPLDKPNRPKTSFNWFVNPLKTFVFFIWKKYKKYIIALLIIAILSVFLVLILYTMPGYISEKIING